MFDLKLIMSYLLLINVITLFVYRQDKRLAMLSLYRIPESALIGLHFAGGTAGALAAMYIFRHKNRKFLFLFKFVIVWVLQIMSILSLYNLGYLPQVSF